MKSLKQYILIIAISALPFISLFSTSLAPHTHDSPVHYARIAAYYKALKEGQILPRWASELNYGYGMPLFNFVYHVPYLVTMIPLAAGAGLVFSFKFALVMSFLLSGVFMFLFSRLFFQNVRKAIIATVLFQFAPYHLVDLVVRGDIAEGFALAFFPLTLYSITRCFHEKNILRNILFICGSSALLILSHNSISLIFFGVAILFSVFFAPTIVKKIEAWTGLGLGLMVSSFYWLPAIIEHQYTYGDLFMKNMYASHFAPLSHFFIPNFTNNSAFQIGGIAVSFGLVQICALLISIALLVQRKFFTTFDKKVMLFCLLLTMIAIFFMQPVSTFLWSSISLLRMFQFPWRFLNITTFSLSIIGAIVLNSMLSSRKIILIIVITILSTLVYFKPPLGFDPIHEDYFWNYPLNTTYFGETDIIWSAGPASEYPKKRFEIIEGEGEIVNPLWKGTIHTFVVTSSSPVKIVDRTQYFPGWRVMNNGNKIPIEFQDQNWRGLITFRLAAGKHNIQIIWGDSPIVRVAKLLTLLSFMGTVGIALWSVKKTSRYE